MHIYDISNKFSLFLSLVIYILQAISKPIGSTISKTWQNFENADFLKITLHSEKSVTLDIPNIQTFARFCLLRLSRGGAKEINTWRCTMYFNGHRIKGDGHFFQLQTLCQILKFETNQFEKSRMLFQTYLKSVLKRHISLLSQVWWLLSVCRCTHFVCHYDKSFYFCIKFYNLYGLYDFQTFMHVIYLLPFFLI